MSNIEVGIESLPAKRAYAWADVLEVPRDAFYLFVMGERKSVEVTEEEELITYYRGLPPSYQRQLREHARALHALAHGEQRKR